MSGYGCGGKNVRNNTMLCSTFAAMAIKPEHDYIAIEGNIGAGKSSLAEMLSKEFGAKLILEEFEDNSFLPKFYKDPKRFAFPLEMSFLAARFNQLKKQLTETDLFQKQIVSDYIFAKCQLFSKVNLEDDEYELYLKLFEIINLQLRVPDLLVYLHNPIEKLQWNIVNRGRSYEQNISPEYLQNLSETYHEYLYSNKNLRILYIDCSNIDFVNNSTHYKSLLNVICKSYTPGIHPISFLTE
ncbi:MAG: deoxynucleoside kinase [Bacteroidia bacterium]|nr:deoxynucleoside kinase [Bacteroidia bacterium]